MSVQTRENFNKKLLNTEQNRTLHFIHFNRAFLSVNCGNKREIKEILANMRTSMHNIAFNNPENNFHILLYLIMPIRSNNIEATAKDKVISIISHRAC